MHRHQHEQRGSVFADVSELAAWSNGRLAESARAAEVPPSRAWRSQAMITAVIAAIAATGFIVVAERWPPRPARLPAIPFQKHDWVLIAAFENRTGERVFDDALRFALERDLSNSRFVNVVSQERAGDVLRLMEKPPQTKMDAAVAREVCLRDGGIRAFVIGRIEKISNKYALSVSLRDSARGVITGGWEETADRQEDVLPALHRISDRMREGVGDALASSSPAELKFAKVTTPSLAVLQLYSQADRLIAEGENARAEELLKEAVTKDPRFASGYIHLAHAIRNQGRPAADYLPPAQRAYELRAGAPDRERYFIEGSYLEMANRLDDARAAYEVLVSLYPDHFWGHSNLSAIYRLIGRENDSVREVAAAADCRPNDFRINADTAWLLTESPSQARVFAVRALKLVTPEIAAARPVDTAWLESFPALFAWTNGDLGGALRETRRLEHLLNSRGADRVALADCVWALYTQLGRLHDAARVLETHTSSRLRHDRLARMFLLRGDSKTAVEEAIRGSEAPFDVGYANFVPLLLARDGRSGIAEEEAKRIETQSRRYARLARSEIAITRGRSEKAVAELRDSIEVLRTQTGAPDGFFVASWDLARLCDERGDHAAALTVMEAASAERSQSALHGSAAFWMRTRFELAKRYRALHRLDEAKRIESELLSLLEPADADYPMLVELKARAGAS